MNERCVLPDVRCNAGDKFEARLRVPDRDNPMGPPSRQQVDGTQICGSALEAGRHGRRLIRHQPDQVPSGTVGDEILHKTDDITGVTPCADDHEIGRVHVKISGFSEQ